MIVTSVLDKVRGRGFGFAGVDCDSVDFWEATGAVEDDGVPAALFCGLLPDDEFWPAGVAELVWGVFLCASLRDTGEVGFSVGMFAGTGLVGVLSLTLAININRRMTPHKDPNIQYNGRPFLGPSDTVPSWMGGVGGSGDTGGTVSVDGPSCSPDTEMLMREFPTWAILDFFFPPSAMKTSMCFPRPTRIVEGVPAIKCSIKSPSQNKSQSASETTSTSFVSSSSLSKRSSNSLLKSFPIIRLKKHQKSKYYNRNGFTS